MTKLITIEELPQYAPGELKLDSSATGRPDFRMRVFRYAPSDSIGWALHLFGDPAESAAGLKVLD